MSEVVKDSDLREGYKRVQLGPRRVKIPETWEKTQLGELGKYLNGYGFKSSDWSDEGRPIIRIQNLTNSAGEETNYYQGEIKDRYIVHEGDLLVSWSATLGVFVWDGPESLLNQHIFKVEPSERVYNDFLYYLLDHNLDLLEMRVQGSTMKHIRKSTFEDTFVPLPPLSEQRRIADILSTVDEQIRRTDEIIEKTNELKQGLMQSFFSNSGSDAVEEVRIGANLATIPQDWNITTLSEVCEKIVDGPHSTPDYVDEGVPFVSAGDITDGEINFEECNHISKEDDEKLRPRVDPHEGDVLLVKVGSSIGKVTLVDTTRRFSIYVQLALLRPDKNEVLSGFLGNVLQYRHMQQQISDNSSGASMPYIGTGRIGSLEIPIPPLEEQKQISRCFHRVRQKLRTERVYKENLQELKHGLMQDLLTGKVRVTTD